MFRPIEFQHTVYQTPSGTKVVVILGVFIIKHSPLGQSFPLSVLTVEGPKEEVVADGVAFLGREAVSEGGHGALGGILGLGAVVVDGQRAVVALGPGVGVVPWGLQRVGKLRKGPTVCLEGEKNAKSIARKFTN